MKYTLITLLVLSFFSPTHAVADTFTIEELDTAAKREKALSNKLFVESRIREATRSSKFLETVESTAYMVVHFRANPHALASPELLRDANAIRLAALKREGLARDSRAYSYKNDPEQIMYNLWTEAVPVGVAVATRHPAAVEGARQIMRHATQTLEGMDAPLRQLEAQSKRADAKRRYWNRARDVFSDWYDLCQTNSEAAKLDALVFGDDNFAPTYASFEDLVKNNRDIVPPVVLEAVESGKIADLESFRRSVNAFTQKTNAAVSKVTKSAADASEAPSTSGPERRLQIEAVKATYKGTVEALDIADAGFQVLGFALQLTGDADFANKVERLGRHSVDIARNIAKYQNSIALSKLDEVSEFSTLKLTTNLVEIVGSIISLFSNEPSFEEVVLEQLQEIRSMIETTRKEMHERFDYVDRNLETIYETMIQGFETLERHVREQHRDVRHVKETLNRVDEAVRSIHGSLYNYLHAGFDRQVRVDVASCLSLDPTRRETSLEDVRACFTNLTTYATELARDPLETAWDEASLTENLFLSLADPHYLPSPWDKIGLVSLIAKKHLRYDALSMREPRLVNVFAWVRYVTAYLTLAQRFPDVYYSYGSHKNTQAILSAGQDLKTAIADLTTVATVDGPTGDFTFLNQAIDMYEIHLEDFNQTLALERADIEDQYTESYALNKGPNQTPKPGKKAFSAENINICPGVTLPATGSGETKRDYLLPTPAALAKPFESEENLKTALELIPAVYFNAHRLGAGTLELCYTDVVWTQKKEIQKPHEFHKLGFQIQANFKADNKVYPIFAKQFYSTQYYKSHNVGPGQLPYDAFNHFHADVHSHFTEEGDTYNSLQAYVEQKQLLAGAALRWEWTRHLVDEFKRGNAKDHVSAEQKEQSARAVAELTNAHIKKEREPVVLSFLNDRTVPSHRMGVRLQKLTGAKHLLQNLVSLALPDSLQSDDETHALLFGNRELLDGETVQAVGDVDAFGLADEETAMGTLAQKHTSALRTHLKNRVTARGFAGGQLDLLETAIMGLKMMSRVHDAFRPKKPIPQALADLRKEIDAL